MKSFEIEVPDYFQEKIRRCFREDGSKWLAGLPELLQECFQKWQLTEYRREENLSFHFICYGHSKRFGEVVLKTGVPHRELFTGIDTLRIYDGRLACRLYDADREKGIMLLERIVPGMRLKDEPDLRERIKAGAALVRNLPLPVSGQHEFPRFQDQMEKAFARARQEGNAGHEFISMLGLAEKLYLEIKLLNRPEVLLHGDLHHENILRDASGNWKVIDPQGRIGEQCLETGRFLLNEWEWFGRTGELDDIAAFIDAFADALGESPRTIAICCFLDFALSSCWSLEDGSGVEIIDKVLASMKSLLGFI